MKVAAILLNWRTADMTLKALDCAVRELKRAGESFRVIVVDNDSGDGSEEKLREGVAQRQRESDDYATVEVVQSGNNGGFGAGNNCGIRHARTHGEAPEYFYILNSDAFADEGSMAPLIQFLDAHPDTAVVGSYLHGSDGEPHVTAFRFPTVQSEFEDAVRFGPISKAMRRWVVPMGIQREVTEVDWLAGASIMLRASVLDEVGLFDETFFLYFEETDLCRRIKQAGHRIFIVPESSVEHVGSVSTGMRRWQRVPQYWFDSRRHYFLKNHGRSYLAAATTAKVVGSALWQVRRRVQGKADPDPDRLLVDLISHSLKHFARNSAR